MKSKDLVVIAATALATFLMGTVVVGPWSNASAEPEGLLTIDPRGVLSSDGVELRATATNPNLQAGERPVVALHAVNASDEARTMKVEIRMASQRPNSRFARMVTMPVEKWKEECLVKLDPGEKKTLEFATGVAVEAGQEITLTLHSARQEIVAAAYAVGAPTIAPAQARQPQLAQATNR